MGSVLKCISPRALLFLVALSLAERICAVTVEPTAAAPAVRSVNHHARQLLVNTDPDPSTPPKTVPFDNSLSIGGPDVPHTDPRVAKRGAACDAPNQAHLTFWTATSVLVSWVTCDYQTGPTVVGPLESPGSTSLVYWRAEWECGGFGNYAYPDEALGGDDVMIDANTAKYRPGKKHHRYEQHKQEDSDYAKSDKVEGHKHTSGHKGSSSPDYNHEAYHKKGDDYYKNGHPGDHDYKGDHDKKGDDYDKKSNDYYKKGDDYHKKGDDYDKKGDDYYKKGDDYYRKGDDYDKKGDDYVKKGHDYDKKGDDYYKKGDDYDKKSDDYYKKGDDYDKKSDDYYKGHDEHPCSKRVHVKGVTTSYFYDYTILDPTNNYRSGIIHHVLIKDLQPGGTYFYKVSGEKTSQVFDFKVPAQTFPLTVGITADPGLTYNTTFVLDRLIAEKPDLVAIIGDFTYADGWKDWTRRLTAAEFAFYPNGLTWQPKWDIWGQLWEPLLAHVPLMHTNGNHEIEGELDALLKPTGVRMRSYNSRYPLPQTAERRDNGPTSFPSATKANKWENLYYAVEVPGVFKAIYITSFSFEQPMTADEEQYKWLQAELAKTDRSKTPWLMVNWHSPWYNTYATHFKENDAMRQAYEGLMLQYKVDVQFHGHVHAYERKDPIANNTVDKCGPVSITIGDGGNIEGTYKDFIDTVFSSKTYCNTSHPSYGRTWNSYQPKNFTMQETRTSWCAGTVTTGTAPCFCYTQQVDWSAYREPSFGYGTLTFESATVATWTWHKNQQSRFEVGDQVKIFRGDSNSPACGALNCQCLTS